MTAVCPLCGQPAAVDLTIRVLCSCGTTLKAPPKMRGRVIACPRCTRPVPIPRGDEAEQERRTVQVGAKTRWVFALALLPIFGRQGDRDDPRKRVDRTLSNTKVDSSSAKSLADKVALIPGAKADRASQPQGSAMPWVYGAAGFALVLAFVWLSFGTPTLGTGEMVVGAGLMAVGGLALGFIVNLIFPPPADSDSIGRLLPMAILAGVGAELFKTWWIGYRKGNLPRRAVLLLGLAVGAGFGAGQAVMTGLGPMAGVALPRAYWMEFVSFIALQSVWAGIAALFLTRGSSKSGSLGSRILAAAGASIGLHAAFELFHRQDMYLVSIGVGLASFALLHALHYWTEETEQETIAGETIRV
jgi:hypothetical protein